MLVTVKIPVVRMITGRCGVDIALLFTSAGKLRPILTRKQHSTRVPKLNARLLSLELVKSPGTLRYPIRHKRTDDSVGAGATWFVEGAKQRVPLAGRSS